MTNSTIAEALKPFDFDWLLSAIGISGPGSLIVIFATKGDFLTACLTHDFQVVWVMTCGGQEVLANSDRANDLHEQSRRLYQIGSA